MSIRTVIEINHDYLAQLFKQPGSWKSFLTGLASGEFCSDFPINNPEGLDGIRVLGQRHHSETLKLEVK